MNKYQASGFTMIAVPVNQFGFQAPHSSKCERAMFYRNVGMNTFPVLDKVKANGPQAVGFYKYLKAQKPEAESSGKEEKHPPAKDGELAWNFEKFLVNEEGQVVARYSPDTDVTSMESKIQELVGSDAASDSQSQPATKSKSTRRAAFPMEDILFCVAAVSLSSGFF